MQSWDDVNEGLKEMARLECEMTIIAAQAGKAKITIEEKAEAKITPLRERYEALDAVIGGFCASRKGEFAKKRSKIFTFGKVRYHIGKSVVLTVSKEAVIKSLKAFGFESCVAVKESVDKKAMEALDDNDLAKVGARRRVEDLFSVEPDMKMVAKEFNLEEVKA